MRPALVPATIVGAWSTVLWHSYIVELGETIGAWQGGGTFDVGSSAAVGLGAALVTFAIVDRPTSRLAPARVPHRWQQLSFRAVAVFAIVGLLALIDRTVTRVPLEVEGSAVFCLCDEHLRHVCRCDSDDTLSCAWTER